MKCERPMENHSYSCWRRKNRSLAAALLVFLAVSSSFLISPADALFECTSATWGEWGSWSNTCPATATGTDPTLVTKRTRSCNKSPFLCWTAISCDGEMSQTLVCGTTTTKEHYSTIVFGTTAFDETTTVGDMRSTEATTASQPETTTEADAVTTSSADATSGTTASEDVATSTKPSDVVTTADGSATTDEASATTPDATTAPSVDEKTTLDFTFASNAPDAATTVAVEESTPGGTSDDECAPPVTTVSTMPPGTMGTLFPGGGGGSGALDPYTFATETPTPMPGVTRSPTCRTTPIVSTTIQFRTCTMIAVSSTTPMGSTSTAVMDSSSTTPSASLSTTLDEKSTTSDSSLATSSEPSASSESATSSEPSASSDSATSSEPGASSDSATSSEPSASSDSATSPDPSGSTQDSVSSEEPSVTSDVVTPSEDTAATTLEAADTTPSVLTTTASTWTTCNDCSQINVQLFNGKPYEDASSVLNRYSSSGCYYVQFFCRPIEIGDTTPVSTILSANTAYLSAPLSASLACRDKKWVLLGSASPLAASVTSLGCVYASTTTTTTTRKPTTIPGVDPNNPCMNCSNLVVSQTIYPEGVTYLDHTLNTCLSVEAHCVPINGGTQVALMYNNRGTLASGATVNRTFTCNKNSKWVDVTSNAVISNISCIMPKTSTTTTTLVPSTIRDLPSTEANAPTKDSSSRPVTERKTTPDVVPPEEETTAAGVWSSTASNDMTTVEHVPSTDGGEVTEDDVPDTTTTLPASCNNCAPLEPLAMSRSGAYNGMLVLWHYRKSGCYRVSISCQTTISATDNATLYYNPLGAVMSGVGELTMDVVCSNGAYVFNGDAIATVSCLATTAALVPATTLPPPTTPAPGDDCSGCNRLPVDILPTSSAYTNGLLKATTSYTSCMSVQLTCYGTTATDQVSLIYADAQLATGRGSANLTLNCNTAGTWVTSALQTVDSISCGYVPVGLTTTTAAPSACGVCSNMESAQALLQTNTYDGMIVLYNYVDSTSNCKKVDISCQGTTATENATLIFDPVGPVLTGTNVHEISLNCSSDGKWKYSGTVINTVSCIVSTATGVVVPATTTDLVSTSTTTLNPAIPMCAQCSRLAASGVTSIDNSLLNGFTTMTFSTINSCSTVQVTCSGSTGTERVTLLAATTSLVSGVGAVSFNFTCNSAAAWMTAAGTIVDSVSCGRYNLTTQSSPVTTPSSTSSSTTTATLAPSQCSKCANMLARAVQPTDGASYDGMIILNHFADAQGCRHVDVSCGPTLNTENATILFGSTIVATGAATHSFSLSCDSTANWVYESTSVSTVSCLISNATSGVTVAPSTASTPKVVDDTAAACSQCGRAPIVSVGSASTYLNGFTTVVQSTSSAGCSLLYIKCQGSTTADAVALLSSGLPLSSSFGSTSTNLTCNAQSQWATASGALITSLACGHKNAATTPSVPSTTLAPTGQCASCAHMTAASMAGSGSTSYDGMVVMDHFIDPTTQCLTVTVTCGPTVSTENATLYFDSTAVSTGMSSHTMTLTCSPSAVWTTGTTVVSHVGCLISTGTGAVGTTASTPAPVTNPSNNLCSQCSRLPVSSSTLSGWQNGFTTLTTTINSFGCATTAMLCQGVSSSELVTVVVNQNNYVDYSRGNTSWLSFACNSQGQWTFAGSMIVTEVTCQRQRSTDSVTATTATATTTTTASSLCNSCPDVRPLSAGAGAYYDGMIVINHYKDRSTNCRKASVDCMTTMDYEVAELLLNNEVINSGSGVGVNLQCSSQGVWTYDSQTYSTTSCLVANTSSLLPTSGKKRRKRQAGTGLTACQSCNTLPLSSLYSFYPYMNGFATISMDDSTTCMTASATCEGTTSYDAVAWIASGTILASGTNTVNLTFTCNSLSSWQTATGSVFSAISCGRQVATTTVATTTTAASQALNCPNLVAAPLSTAELGSDETNGQLILDHYIDTSAMAREVTITCYGSSATDNTTISFNGGSRTLSGTGQIQLTLTCDASGQWMRNGIGVQTVACIVVSPPGSTVPLTTTIPTTPTTSAGSLPSTNCARNVMLTVPTGYNAGYLSMNTISTESSLQVVMSCAAPTGISESLLLSSSGAVSTSSAPTTNLTLTCNSASQWVVSSASGSGIPVGTVITSIACVVAASSTTTLVPATVPASCQQCANLPAVGLLSTQLDANERNGQFILDHVSSPNACRAVYLSCAGSTASENSTIVFNGGAETMSNQGITSTVLTCTSSSTWDWYGATIGYASCKVADRALTSTTTTAPTSLTTTAYTVPGDTGLACSRSTLVNPLITGDAGAYLVLDTTIRNGGLSTSLSCAAPDGAGSAVLTNGDGSVLGQSSSGLINMTLTCNSNSQWVITAISSSGTTAALGTVVEDLKCGEIAAATTTLATTTSSSTGACQNCPNMQAIALSTTQLAMVSGASNGQLLLSHSVDSSSKCRIVVIKCRGENTNQNATIFFNANGQSLSAMYGQVATSMACSSSNIWSRSGVEIDGVACMITSTVGATSTSPSPITTVAASSTTQSANGPAASCNTAFTTAVASSGYSSGFMTVDTTVSGTTMTASVQCAAPVTTQTAALLGSTGTQVSSGVGSTSLTLTCNSASQWVISSGTSAGTVVTTLSCGTVDAATTTSAPVAAATTTTASASTGDCSTATWNAWGEWSTCTDTCGSCGTQQRFRSCNKPQDTCTCTGSAYEKEYCELAVCKFPRTACCDGFTPRSSGGTFVCMT